MASHLYEGGVTKTTGAAAGPILSIVPAAIAGGVQPPEIVEIGIFNVTGVVAELGIGYPAAAGTGTATETAVQLSNSWLNSADTELVTSYGTLQPTAPTNYLRRFMLQGVVGAGVIFTWARNEWLLWSGATINAPVLWQISALAVTYDVYVKVIELYVSHVEVCSKACQEARSASPGARVPSTRSRRARRAAPVVCTILLAGLTPVCPDAPAPVIRMLSRSARQAARADITADRTWATGTAT